MALEQRDEYKSLREAIRAIAHKIGYSKTAFMQGYICMSGMLALPEGAFSPMSSRPSKSWGGKC